MCRRIPQFLSESTQSALEKQADIQDKSIKTLFSLQFLLMFLFGTSINALFGVVRPIQYIGILVLCQVVFPGNLYKFFKNIMDKVHFDAFETQENLDESDA